MPQPPSLTPEQRAAALEKAARIRKERAAIKRDLKEGRLSLAAALDQAAGNEAIAKMKVLVLLESLPALGKVKARRLLDQMIDDVVEILMLDPQGFELGLDRLGVQ